MDNFTYTRHRKLVCCGKWWFLFSQYGWLTFFVIFRIIQVIIRKGEIFMRKLLLAMLALIPTSVMANPACPVCTIAVGAGLDIARRLGVPDSIVGLWAGALLTLLGYWMLKWMDKKNWHFRGRDTIVIVLSVAMIGFVYLGTVRYNPVSICGAFVMDPVLFGTICGALIFVGMGKLYQWMKNKNGGHAHFPFEKVVLPVVALVLASWAMMLCF